MDRYLLNLDINESHFKGNKAAVHDGSMYVNGTGFSQTNIGMESRKFAKNLAREDGGAIYLAGSSLLELRLYFGDQQGRQTQRGCFCWFSSIARRKGQMRFQ